MKSILQQYILPLFLVVGAWSCTDDESIDTTLPGDGKVQFKVEVTSSNETKATTIPGDPALNENVISTLDIIFYKNGTNVYYPLQSDITFNSSSGLVTLNIPRSAWPLFDNTTTYQMLVIANLDRVNINLANMTYSQVQSTIQQSDFSTATLQTNFLMQATVNTVLSLNSNLPNVSLQRAAVKIRPTVSFGSISGYTLVAASAMLQSYIDKTSLTAGSPYSSQASDYKNTAYRPFSMSGASGTMASPFYSYENDWTYSVQKQTYLLVKATFSSTSGQQDYYYKVPFNYLNSSNVNDSIAFKLLRNTIYDINITINQLGSTNPDTPVTLNGNFTLVDWTTHNIVAQFLNYQYMVVKELFVQIYNVANRNIGYASSMPIQILNLAASCDQYDTSGNHTILNYVVGNPEFPTVTIDSLNYQLKINSSIPINYVPKTITFTVQTIGVPVITQAVKIVQYPPIYVTAQYSTDLNAGDQTNATANFPTGSPPTQVNFNQFMVTTVVPTDTVYKIGDPRQYSGSTMTTRTDAEGNNLRSPQFVVASQRGITYSYVYSQAQSRCLNYQELPYLKGKWRMPTMAEIILINQIQTDTNSAVKRLLMGSAYWSAYQYAYYNFVNPGFAYVGSNDAEFIRCVTDTWDL